jgi:hypothetical protein
MMMIFCLNNKKGVPPVADNDVSSKRFDYTTAAIVAPVT